jgi:hypothetical protein
MHTILHGNPANRSEEIPPMVLNGLDLCLGSADRSELNPPMILNGIILGVPNPADGSEQVPPMVLTTAISAGTADYRRFDRMSMTFA